MIKFKLLLSIQLQRNIELYYDFENTFIFQINVTITNYFKTIFKRLLTKFTNNKRPIIEQAL